MGENLNIFTIYTSEDGAVMQQLVKRLISYEKDTNITIWSENPILPDQAWKPQSESRFTQTDIFILLVSDAFMHSQFIQQLEFKKVIDQYKGGSSAVIPVIIDRCPWDIDFRSDDYNFNLNELGVLPDAGKPLKEWESSEQVYDDIAKEIKAVIASLSENNIPEEIEEEEDEKLANVKEEQIAIAFDEEKEAQKEKRLQEETEAKRIAEAHKARAEAQAKQKVAERQKLQEEAESKRRAEEQRIKEAAESKRKAEEQKEREAAESRKIAEAKRKKEEAEQKIQAEQERWSREQENQQEQTTAQNSAIKEAIAETKSKSRKMFLIGGIVALLAIIGIWTFNSGTDDAIQPSVDTNAAEVKDSIPDEKTEIEPESEPIVEEESLSELAIGDQYNGGIVFSINSDGKTGKVVHIDDAGPMPWADAMIIHDQLGKGWRLPTLDELKILYDSLGQGASNSAEFADKLYWSATLYDDYQARLLQFRTGNTSYHYNKEAEHRQFLVRAVRDFNR